MDDTNFVDDVGSDLYIDDVDEANEVSHGDESKTPSDESYGDLITEEFPKQDNIDHAAYEKYVPGEGPRRAKVRRCVEYLD